MTQSHIVLEVAALTVGILSVVPAVHATEPPEVDSNVKTIGEPFAPGDGATVSLSLSSSENLSFGAVAG